MFIVERFENRIFTDTKVNNSITMLLNMTMFGDFVESEYQVFEIVEFRQMNYRGQNSTVQIVNFRIVQINTI